jgi:hypothetical protein
VLSGINRGGPPSRAVLLLLLLVDIEAHPALDLPGGVIQVLALPGNIWYDSIKLSFDM